MNTNEPTIPQVSSGSSPASPASGWVRDNLSSRERIVIKRVAGRKAGADALPEIARQFLLDVVPPRACVDALLAVLVRPQTNWRIDREVAAILLGRMRLYPEDRYAAYATLGRVIQWTVRPMARGQTLRWFARSIFGGTIFFALVCALFIASTVPGPSRDWSDVCAILLFAYVPALVIGFPVSESREQVSEARVRVAVAAALGRLKVPESAGVLGWLVDGSTGVLRREGSPSVVRAVTSALYEVLGTLTPQHYGKLDSETVPALCGLPQSARTELAARILRALGKIGDSRAVQPVERMAQRGRTEELRELARSILPVLYERREHELSANTLLRASAANSGIETLLRAAEPVSAVDPKALLRATEASVADPYMNDSKLPELTVRE